MSGKTISLVVGQATGNISFQVAVYLGSVLVGNLQPKVVGVNISTGGCTGKRCSYALGAPGLSPAQYAPKNDRDRSDSNVHLSDCPGWMWMSSL
jgi:hypothetical protein